MAAVVVGLAAAGAGCLARPVESADPNLKTSVQFVVPNDAIDKIDLLFDIDNSASMGDKQQYLAKAIPDLITRLVSPNCVSSTNTSTTTGASSNGTCPTGSQLEFPAVHDMHIGIVSSSLGSRLGDQCDPNATAPSPFEHLLRHNDDRGELLNRSLAYSLDMSSAIESTVDDAAPVPQDQFLYWYPQTAANSATPTAGTRISDPNALGTDFTELVSGVGVFGCGVESQLESWYRFLIQPDPYSTLTSTNGKANWSGVDATIIQQRHDFLRPDSLVAVIVLSDENDSEIDVRSLGQQGYSWMKAALPLPRGTSACGTDGVGGTPNDPNCVSCAQVSSSEQSSDPNCAMGPYSSLEDWGFDLNLRHVHTKAKYGLDPQFPIGRYVNGLTSPKVPDRFGEYPVDSNGNIKVANYQGTNDCTNPLFASELPTGSSLDPQALCQLPAGQRTKDLVFYAHIGGVPWQLLHFDPTSEQASTLTDADWVKILGKDPQNFDYSGIDPHMIESYQPRSGIAGPGSPPGTDLISGHEWITNQGTGHILNVDREYACTFQLADGNGNATPRDCTQTQYQSFCDCPAAATLTTDQLPPICDPKTQTLQTGAKAYPTIRELLLANLMGKQGIVASICPEHVSEQGAGDPLFGYRPAVAAIIDRLKGALTNQCLPEQLQVTDGTVPCLILVTLPQAPGGGTCKNPDCNQPGLVGPGGQIAAGQVFDQNVLDDFCDSQNTAYEQAVQAAGGDATELQDPALQSVCAMVQLTATANPGDFSGGSCKNSKEAGWCYVTGAPAGDCPQAILFADGPPHGSIVNLQCIEQSVGVLDGGSAVVAPTVAAANEAGASE
jgi:hypothetical protein